MSCDGGGGLISAGVGIGAAVGSVPTWPFNSPNSFHSSICSRSCSYNHDQTEELTANSLQSGEWATGCDDDEGG